MIIFEGPDNAGKSTAIKQVIHRIPILKKAGHSGGPPKDDAEWVSRVYDTLLRSPKETVNEVYDRLYFSELVYGKVLRGKLAAPDNVLQSMAERLYEHEPLIIYCRRPLHRIKEGFDEREQLSGVYENLTKICWEYDRLFSTGWNWNLYVYDFEEDETALNRLVGRILFYLQEKKVPGLEEVMVEFNRRLIEDKFGIVVGGMMMDALKRKKEDLN